MFTFSLQHLSLQHLVRRFRLLHLSHPLGDDTAKNLTPGQSEVLYGVKLSIDLTEEERAAILAKLVCSVSTPCVRLDTNVFRRRPTQDSKSAFREELLQQLRSSWRSSSTEKAFLDLAEVLESQGCLMVASLIDPIAFQALIQSYTHKMGSSGRTAFLHNFLNLADHADFLLDAKLNHGFIHPLMVALISYLMGGPIRAVDIRGKDTEPISVQAQDNMLHIDNTPFREEYKILVCWERGKVKGPTGQNFTFMPGTHKGNRHIRFDADRHPWSTENDSIFLTDEAVDGLVNFQRHVTGRGPVVVEVEYPSDPVTVTFSAGSLVHHRYRTKNGNSRSCIITAFHLVSDNPGGLVRCSNSTSQPKTLTEALIFPQDGGSRNNFVSLLRNEAHTMEAKISDILNSMHKSSVVDTQGLELSGEALRMWREAVVSAPSASSVRQKRNYFLSYSGRMIRRRVLLDKVASVMSYDKHGLLDLILYDDIHEEIRKVARRRIWSMTNEQIRCLVVEWVPKLGRCVFLATDIIDPDELQRMVALITSIASADVDNAVKESEPALWPSYRQLLIDLGESIKRCENVETYLTTTLFIFLALYQVLPSMVSGEKQKVEQIAVAVLRCYLASVLVTEHM